MQCFKVFWTGVESDEGIDSVDEEINKPIAAMLETEWRIVNVKATCQIKRCLKGPWNQLLLLA